MNFHTGIVFIDTPGRKQIDNVTVKVMLSNIASALASCFCSVCRSLYNLLSLSKLMNKDKHKIFNL